jgi:chitinase
MSNHAYRLLVFMLSSLAVACGGSNGPGSSNTGGTSGAGGSNGGASGAGGKTGVGGGNTGGSSDLGGSGTGGSTGVAGSGAGGVIGAGGNNTGGNNTGGNNTGGSSTSASPIFSPYKDVTINLNWNTNVLTTKVTGTATPLTTALASNGAKAVTLAFATGECGTESWGGVPGATLATANLSALTSAGIKYILATGGATGSFTCTSDAGFAAFLSRWESSNLIGVDFDIEGGQTQAVVEELVKRIQAAHSTHPGLLFSLTIATLANNNGATTAQSLGPSVANSLNAYGDWTLNAVKSVLGWTSSSTWPSYLTVNLMTMDYGAAGPGACVVNGGTCDMGQSAIQAAYNLHDRWGVPYSNIELTPMIGGNDVLSEQFTLADVDTMTTFAIKNGLAGVHYWSLDRDVDCPAGAASATCNSLGTAGTYGFLSRFLAAGLR